MMHSEIVLLSGRCAVIDMYSDYRRFVKRWVSLYKSFQVNHAGIGSCVGLVTVLGLPALPNLQELLYPTYRIYKGYKSCCDEEWN